MLGATQAQQEIIDFIERHEDLSADGYFYRHCYVTPGEEGFITEYYQRHGEVLPIMCDCCCKDPVSRMFDHTHFIFKTKLNATQWESANKALLRRLRREGKSKPDKCFFGKQGNSSHLMNKVLYILGPDSKNYRNGFAKIVKNAHQNQRHPFSALPSAHLLDQIRKHLVDEDDEKQADYQAWKNKFNKDRSRWRRNRASA